MPFISQDGGLFFISVTDELSSSTFSRELLSVSSLASSMFGACSLSWVGELFCDGSSDVSRELFA